MQPGVPAGRAWGLGGQARRDETGGEGTRRHGPYLGTAQGRVKRVLSGRGPLRRLVRSRRMRCFPLIVEALARLRSRSCILAGGSAACNENGLASFDLIRHHRTGDRVFLYAFDLIELNGDDLRQDPLEVRKATLTSVVAKAGAGRRFNEHLESDDGEAVFRHACKMGLEGIVSKRKDSPYRSGRSKIIPFRWAASSRNGGRHHSV